MDPKTLASEAGDEIKKARFDPYAFSPPKAPAVESLVEGYDGNIRIQVAGHLDEQGVVEQNGAEDEALGIQVDGKTLIEDDVGDSHRGAMSY